MQWIDFGYPNQLITSQYLSVLLNDFGTVYLNEPIPRVPSLKIFKLPSRFNWGTEYLKEITQGKNQVMVSPEVIGEAELVDILFEPNSQKSRTYERIMRTFTYIFITVKSFRGFTPRAF